jgi:hypothetical protein
LERLVLAEHNEALIAAVSRESRHHGWEADREREAAREFDVDAEEQDERRNQDAVPDRTPGNPSFPTELVQK